MAGLLERLRARTATPRQAKRGQPYNYPQLWYCRSDGDVVKLPGDPPNRAYYEDKGYTVLRPEEVEEWEREVRPQVIEKMREKASLISTIRRIGSKHPGVEIVDNLDDLEAAELRELLEEVGKVTGAPVTVIARRFGASADAPDRDDAPEIRGGDELADKLKRAAAREKQRS